MTRDRLPGTLDGDFSRFRFDPARRNSAVRLQQGRVILDSDWNEQSEIHTYRRRTGFADLIGPSGGPADGAGFAVQAGSALELDGENHFLVIGGDGTPVWSGGEASTVELWISPAGGGVLLGRFSRGEADGGFRHDYTLAVEADGRLVLHRPAEVGGSLGTTAALTFGRMSHIALVSDRSSTCLLLDGQPVAEDARGLPLGAVASVAVLGATVRSGRPTQAFAGLVHELRFWATRRAVGELAQLGRPGAVAGEAPGLVGLWRFDHGLTPGQSPPAEIPDSSPHGVPAVLGGGRAEHRPAVRPAQLSVLPGRYYVEGMLCEQASAEPLGVPTQQQLAAGSTWLLYLEAWEHLVSAEQEPQLLEPALGGADTAARSRIACRVRALEAGEALPPADGDAVDAAWSRYLDAWSRRGRLMARRKSEMIGSDPGNLLYRVEIHGGGAAASSPWTGDGESMTRFLEATRAAGDCIPPRARFRLDRWPGDGPMDPAAPWSHEPWQAGQAVELRAESEDAAVGLYATVVTVDDTDRVLELEADGLDRWQGDQALRLRRLATFVWSRDNGSVLFPVRGVEDGGLEVQLETSVRSQPLEVGDWVEWLDPDPEKRPGRLHRVTRLDPMKHTAVLDPPAAAKLPEGAGRAVLRRWDQRELEDTWLVGGALVVTDDWQPLEAGFEARFMADGPYRAGDYWWLPVRTAHADVEWPSGEDGPLALEPDGVQRRRALIAAVGRGPEGGIERIDYRRTFQPATTGAVSKAGDTMYGPLQVDADVVAAGDVTARRLFGELGSPGAVGELNLRDGAVSARTLAPDVGVVPDGASILGDSPEAPPGYRWTGAAHLLYHEQLTWCRLAPMPRQDSKAQAAAAAGRVWLIYESGEVWIYDPDGRCWQPGPAVEPRSHFALAALDDRLYLIGGTIRGRATDSCEVFDPAVGSWQATAPLRKSRSHLAATALEGHLYAVGGLEGRAAVARTEAFDPVLDRWQRCRPMPTPRFDLAAAAVAGRVFAVGGARKPLLDRFGCELVSHVEAYHPPSDRWLDHLASLDSPRSELAASAAGDRLYAAGGLSTAGALDLVDEYDPAPDHWRRRHALPGVTPRPATALLDGWLYVLGVDENGTPEGAYAAKVASKLYVHRRLDVPDPVPALPEPE